MQQWWFGNFMQIWSCMHRCGHSSIEFLWSCDTRAQDSFSLFKSTQCFQNMFFFINSCIHLSPFWAFGKIFVAFTLQVHINFFHQKLVLWSVNLFSKKSWKLFLFKSVLAFQPKDIFFVHVCFCFFSFFFKRLKIACNLDTVDAQDHIFFKKACERKCTRPTHFFAFRTNHRKVSTTICPKR